MSSTALRALVVDDEPLARRRVQRLLETIGDVRVVGLAASADEFVPCVLSSAPDVVFLDIEMPGLDGFGALASLPAGLRPCIVFVTAYSEHAVKAFEVGAVHYVLKPIALERLREAVQRVREFLARSVSLPTGAGYAAILTLPTGTALRRIPVDEIDYATAHANYIELHTRRQSFVLRETMSGLEARLDPARFLRIHRSRIVRVDAIETIEPQASGQFVFRLHSGIRLGSGRIHRDRIRARLDLA